MNFKRYLMSSCLVLVSMGLVAVVKAGPPGGGSGDSSGGDTVSPGGWDGGGMNHVQLDLRQQGTQAAIYEDANPKLMVNQTPNGGGFDYNFNMVGSNHQMLSTNSPIASEVDFNGTGGLEAVGMSGLQGVSQP